MPNASKKFHPVVPVVNANHAEKGPNMNEQIRESPKRPSFDPVMQIRGDFSQRPRELGRGIAVSVMVIGCCVLAFGWMDNRIRQQPMIDLHKPVSGTIHPSFVDDAAMIMVSGVYAGDPESIEWNYGEGWAVLDGNPENGKFHGEVTATWSNFKQFSVRFSNRPEVTAEVEIGVAEPTVILGQSNAR